MATLTPRLALRKPDGTDLVNVLTDISENCDDLDANPGVFIGTAAQRAALAGSQLWDGRHAFETDTKLKYVYNVTLAAWIPDGIVGVPITTFVPTWTGTINPVLGNGALTTRWSQVGKMVDFWMGLTMGSTTTYGTGLWSFSLPVAARAGGQQIMPVLLASAGAVIPAYAFLIVGTAFFNILTQDNAPATVNCAYAGLNVPNVWAATDFVVVQGRYEAT